MAKLYLICDKEKSCHEKKHSQMLCCTVTVRWHGSLYQEVYHGTGRPQTLICTNTSVQTNHEDFYFEERHQNVWSNQLYWDKEKDQCLYFSFTQCDTLKAKYTATVFHRFVFTFEHHLKLFSLPRVIKNNVKKKVLCRIGEGAIVLFPACQHRESCDQENVRRSAQPVLLMSWNTALLEEVLVNSRAGSTLLAAGASVRAEKDVYLTGITKIFYLWTSSVAQLLRKSRCIQRLYNIINILLFKYV